MYIQCRQSRYCWYHVYRISLLVLYHTVYNYCTETEALVFSVEITCVCIVRLCLLATTLCSVLSVLVYYLFM